MKKFISILLVIISMASAITLSSCTTADTIEEGVYICKTPYIKYIYKDLDHLAKDQIEIDQQVYDAFTLTGYDGKITFIEYQPEEVNPTDGWYTEDNEEYAEFDYKFDKKKKQLILTDRESGNVYHLDKLEKLEGFDKDVTVYTDDTMTPYEITEEQASSLQTIADYPAALSDRQGGYLHDVGKLFPVNEVRMFDTEQGDTFYYSTFRCNESTIAVIYDSDYWICGWLYYNEPVSLEDLNNAKTLADVEKIDSTLTDNSHYFNHQSADTLVDHRGYSLFETGTDFTAATTHYTEDGLYVIQYSLPFYESNSEENEILSIERIDDEVYNTVCGLLNNKAVG